jgi:hypothetical protein
VTPSPTEVSTTPLNFLSHAKHLALEDASSCAFRTLPGLIPQYAVFVDLAGRLYSSPYAGKDGKAEITLWGLLYGLREI